MVIAALARRAALGLLAICLPPPGAASLPAVSRARTFPELSNSIIASRDTNVSPKEIYDFLTKLVSTELRPEKLGGRRALDLGAGAGVSTQVLWDAGWREIVAVDPSRLAWDKYSAGDALPAGVEFLHASDESFLASRRAEPQPAPRFNLVIVNYAVNQAKAVSFARELLAPGGRLLAPSNVQADYWFEQVYQLIDEGGAVLWSRRTLGSYDVLFQPDFTSPTCQGQWCPKLREGDEAAKGLNL